MSAQRRSARSTAPATPSAWWHLGWGCCVGAFDNITHYVGDTVATAVTRWVMSGAAEPPDLLLSQFSSSANTTRPFTTPWFEKVYYGDVPHATGVFPGQAGALTIADLVSVPLLVLTVIVGVVRGDIKTVLGLTGRRIRDPGIEQPLTLVDARACVARIRTRWYSRSSEHRHPTSATAVIAGGGTIVTSGASCICCGDGKWWSRVGALALGERPREALRCKVTGSSLSVAAVGFRRRQSRRDQRRGRCEPCQRCGGGPD